MKTIGWAAVAVAAVGLAQSAQAAPCASASVSTYTASGFSCSVGGVTFSSISINTLGVPASDLGNLAPVMFSNGGTQELGLQLNFAAVANSTTPTTDVDLTFTVAGNSGNQISDAFMSLAGTDSGGATSTLGETLSNGVSLQLMSPGATSASFSPVASLLAIKDQLNSANGGLAETSNLVDAFSVTGGVPVSATPIPGTLPLFASGLVGFWGWTRRRKPTAKPAV